MAQSFSANRALADMKEGEKRSVLVTGASGNIGSYFAEHSHERYRLRLMVHEIDDESRQLEAYGELVEGNLGDAERLYELCRGIDTVLHLAASASPSTPWEDVLENNIVGTYNMMVAAKRAGCHRLIYASSIHAVSGYPADVQVKPSDPVNPGDLYGVSKCFGEALGRYMAEQEGLSVIALRIGAFQPQESALKEENVHMLDAWVSRRDLNQLIEKCIDADEIKFAIFNGLSDNRFKRLDISSARELLGYAPVDDFTETNPKVKPLKLRETVSAHSMQDEGQKSGIRNEVAGKGAPEVCPPAKKGAVDK